MPVPSVAPVCKLVPGWRETAVRPGSITKLTVAGASPLNTSVTKAVVTEGTVNVARPPPMLSILRDARAMPLLQLSTARNTCVLSGWIIGASYKSRSGISTMPDSEIVDIPLRDLYDAPMIQPESTQVFLAVDNCNKGIARASLKIDNIGGSYK